MASPADTFELTSATGVVPTETYATTPASSAGSDRETQVVDDLPRPLPVMAKEADVVEMFLAALLDDLLGKSRVSACRTSSVP